MRKGFLINFAKLTGKNLCKDSFLIKFIKKETLAQVFFRELFEISKSTFFTEHLLATASDYFYSNFGKIQNI